MTAAPETPVATEHLDVLVVGAGLSGISAACHLQAECPGRTYAVLEARGDVGGTWDLFRYPGIRSDSDMFTLGFSFRPWADKKAIADGPSILAYVRDTAHERGVDAHIRFHHRVVRAAWDSGAARWTVEAERTDTGEPVRLTCGFLFSCTGYYRYDEGYTPPLPGIERYRGEVVHPQHWTDAVEYAGKRVLVIGSGATAVTLVPAMARDAAHVTMLQRSPSYVLSLPNRDPIAEALRRRLPDRVVDPMVRWKNILLTMGNFQLSRRRPELMKRVLRRGAVRQLPEGYDVDVHFKPRYDPWDQRLCIVPDGDLFAAIREGRAAVATGAIETFTETGVRLASGEELEADLVVTATGLNMLALGGMELAVDAEAIVLAEKLAYKGLMLSDVPNLAIALGYTNASWTLKCELICEYVCRLLNHMAAHGCTQATPRPGGEAGIAPFIDLSSGYVQRSIAAFPRQGAGDPWRVHQNYLRDIRLLRRGPVDDGMEFRAVAGRPAEREPGLLAA
jgi:monooxygenase